MNLSSAFGKGARFPLLRFVFAPLFWAAFQSWVLASPVLHNFTGTDGSHPNSGLILVGGDTLYGTTTEGGSFGYGTIYKVNLDGTGFVVLHDFRGTDGANAHGLVASGTTIYGTTEAGGTAGLGTVFKLNSDGTGYEVLHNFTGVEGANPCGALVCVGTNLYGMTRFGGSGNGGTVFRLNQDGSGHTLLREFVQSAQDGGYWPNSDLVLCGDALFGSLGATLRGAGALFRISLNGSGYLEYWNNWSHSLTASGNFAYWIADNQLFRVNSDGIGLTVATLPMSLLAPHSLAVFGDKLYGTTRGYTTIWSAEVFALNTDGSGCAILKSLPESDGSILWGPLVLAGSCLYGTTYDGGLGEFGTASSHGTIIQLRTNPGPPLITLQPAGDAVDMGGMAVFQVGAGNLEDISYQWVFDGNSPLPGQTNSVLLLTNLQPAQTGAYSAVLTNSLGSITSAPALLHVIPPGTTPVEYCTAGALRAALAGAGPVTFACDGTITVQDTLRITANTLIDASGHTVRISGGGRVPVFRVSSNTTFTAKNLTISSGRGSTGAGIYNDGGVVNLSGCTFIANRALAPDQPYSGGTNGTDGSGGAVFNLGSLNASSCTFLQNIAMGGAGSQMPSPGPQAAGAGLAGGQGNGGAIYNLGTLTVDRCSFISNSVSGGRGGYGQSGFYNWMLPSAAPGASGGTGGDANGAAVCNSGWMAASRSLFAENESAGGPGGNGGGGYGAGPGPLVVSAGGAGGAGGQAFGAGLHNAGTAAVVCCTFALNPTRGGAGGVPGSGGSATDHGYTVRAPDGSPGKNGSAFGALMATNGMLWLTNCTIAANPSTNCGGIVGSAVAAANTLLVANGSRNALGQMGDLGHNLSSDASCAFTNIGSLNAVNPGVGPLRDNGGQTLTFALLPGSPAIGTGNAALAPATDQRALPRPAGAADIGACWFAYVPLVEAMEPRTGGVDIVASGQTAQTAWLLASPDLFQWAPVATNTFGPGGTFNWHEDPTATGQSRRFYRVFLP